MSALVRPLATALILNHKKLTKGNYCSQRHHENSLKVFPKLHQPVAEFGKILSKNPNLVADNRKESLNIEVNGVSFPLRFCPDDSISIQPGRIHKYFPLATEFCHAAYCSSDCQYLVKNEIQPSNIRRFQAPFHCLSKSIKDQSTAIMAVSESQETIVLSFQGTSSSRQLLKQIFTVLFLATPFPGGGKMLKYHVEATNSLWPQVKEALIELIDQHPGYDILICGYSKGAVLAKLAAAKLVLEGLCPKEQLNLVTFGEPASGDKENAAEIKNLDLNYFRLRNKYDPVPHLTPWLHPTGYPIVIDKPQLWEILRGFVADAHKNYLSVEIGGECIPEAKALQCDGHYIGDDIEV